MSISLDFHKYWYYILILGWSAQKQHFDLRQSEQILYSHQNKRLHIIIHRFEDVIVHKHV